VTWWARMIEVVQQNLPCVLASITAKPGLFGRNEKDIKRLLTIRQLLIAFGRIESQQSFVLSPLFRHILYATLIHWRKLHLNTMKQVWLTFWNPCIIPLRCYLVYFYCASMCMFHKRTGKFPTEIEAKSGKDEERRCCPSQMRNMEWKETRITYTWLEHITLFALVPSLFPFSPSNQHVFIEGNLLTSLISCRSLLSLSLSFSLP